MWLNIEKKIKKIQNNNNNNNKKSLKYIINYFFITPSLLQ